MNQTPPPTPPSPPSPLLFGGGPYSVFGYLVWDFLTGIAGPQLFENEVLCESVLPLALQAGLCRRVRYNPAIHGPSTGGYEPGDEIWWLGEPHAKEEEIFSMPTLVGGSITMTEVQRLRSEIERKDAALREAIDAFERYEMDVDDYASPAHRAMMTRIRTALSSAEDHSPDTEKMVGDDAGTVEGATRATKMFVDKYVEKYQADSGKEGR